MLQNRFLVNVGLFFLLVGFVCWNTWNHSRVKKINRNSLLRLWVWMVSSSGMKSYRIIKTHNGYIAI